MEGIILQADDAVCRYLGVKPCSLTDTLNSPMLFPSMWYQKVTQASDMGLRYLEDMRLAVSPAWLAPPVSTYMKYPAQEATTVLIQGDTSMFTSS